ncbi:MULTISPECIES: TIGR04157 family glycosyltransferase [Bacteroidales]|uniref:TIGR04157 family glycosyltransferase n=1 Tax=Tannerella forsythia TaxID=28112 RepID=A0A3P1XM13_TANFO|nr:MULTISPECIES: TIGR04157 family glycosyltransferase [Bacteroidales]ATR96314.1 glycosyl transferase family 1 [Porphyromonas gingivalis]RRD59505.1 TIGR04157 family glycosyltransferase [Tannerella forsythia]
MKRNLYILNELSPAGTYGIGTYISQVQECFSNEKDISVYVIQLCSKEGEYHFDPETNTFHIPIGRRHSSDKRAQYIRGAARLLKLHLHFSGTNIFLFNFYTHSELIDLIKNSFSGCKIVFTIHYMEWTFLLKGNTKQLKSILKHSQSEQKTLLRKQVYEAFLEEKEVLEKADHIICLSQYARNLLTSSYGINNEKLTMVYNGLKDETKSLKATKRELRKELHISVKEKIFLYVGRLHKDKGGKELVKAFQRVVQANPLCRLIVVGDGNVELYQNESENIWSRITYTGRINKAQVYKFYKIADVGVLPSFSEQCSYVALEMMMFGLPIVGTDSTGLAEMIDEDGNGYKIELQETEEDVELSEHLLAEKMIKLLNSPYIRQFGKNSRDKFLRNYTIGNMQNSLRRLIYDTL